MRTAVLSSKFPAVLVPYYEPETSIGTSNHLFRDYAWQLARRGFVTLSIGSPGGDARKPVLDDEATFSRLVILVTSRQMVGMHWHR